MKPSLLLVLCLLLLPSLPLGATSLATHRFPEEARQQALPEPPLQARQAIVGALRHNRYAELLLAIEGEHLLREFLEAGAEHDAKWVAEQVPKLAADPNLAAPFALWRTLAGRDGVARASAEWYPRWLEVQPRFLAFAQMFLAGMAEQIARHQTLDPVERAQMTELHWALSGWLSRTDFADRKRFETLLGLARELILASGKDHPLELVLIKGEQRLALADTAMRQLKRGIALYGLDVDGMLDSLAFEELERGERHARIRTSLKILDVPLAWEERLLWVAGRWLPSDHGEGFEPIEPSAGEGIDEMEPDATGGAFAEDPVFQAPARQQPIGRPGGCAAPSGGSP